MPESDSKLSVDEAEDSKRGFKRARLLANLEREFQKLGISRDGYIHLLPQDGPDVSKRVWERQARVAREALRSTALLNEEVLVQLGDRLKTWAGQGVFFSPMSSLSRLRGVVSFASSNCNANAAIQTLWLVWLGARYLHARLCPTMLQELKQNALNCHLLPTRAIWFGSRNLARSIARLCDGMSPNKAAVEKNVCRSFCASLVDCVLSCSL